VFWLEFDDCPSWRSMARLSCNTAEEVERLAEIRRKVSTSPLSQLNLGTLPAVPKTSKNRVAYMAGLVAHSCSTSMACSNARAKGVAEPASTEPERSSGCHGTASRTSPTLALPTSRASSGNGTASPQGLRASNPRTRRRTNPREATPAPAPAISRKSMWMVMTTAAFRTLHLISHFERFLPEFEARRIEYQTGRDPVLRPQSTAALPQLHRAAFGRSPRPAIVCSRVHNWTSRTLVPHDIIYDFRISFIVMISYLISCI
jgi:hypothetical protein